MRFEQVSNRRVSIQYEGHQGNSRGKLPHISRRASAISSFVMSTFRSFQSPRRLRRGLVVPFLTDRKSTKSKTSCCLSAGNSRTFSTTCSAILIPKDHYTTAACEGRVPFITRARGHPHWNYSNRAPPRDLLFPNRFARAREWVPISFWPESDLRAERPWP